MNIKAFITVLLTGLAATSSWALEPALQAKVDAILPQIKALAQNPGIIADVRLQNSSPTADDSTMTQEKWQSLLPADPFIRRLTKTPSANALRESQIPGMSESFVSGAEGRKVGFLAKTTSWSHKGSPKHEEPMTGKTWIGKPEIDKSSGQLQIQVSVPVLDGEKPIGSLVVGVSLITN